MNSYAQYMDMLTVELDRLPAGTEVSYVGQATIFMQKQSDGSWVNIGCDTGIKSVTSSYLAAHHPYDGKD